MEVRDARREGELKVLKGLLRKFRGDVGSVTITF